jgi:hypothetical protein
MLAHSLKATGFKPLPLNTNPGFKMCLSNSTCATLPRGGLKWTPAVGRCALTPPDPRLKGAWYSGGFNPCTYQVKNRFQNVPFKCNLQRYPVGLSRGPRPGGGACAAPTATRWWGLLYKLNSADP